jgi:hypothetical protein
MATIGGMCEAKTGIRIFEQTEIWATRSSSRIPGVFLLQLHAAQDL